MFVEKIAGGLALTGMVTAQAAPLDPWHQLITTSVCGAILAWMIFRTLPQLSENHRVSTQAIAEKNAEAVRDMSERHSRDVERLSNTHRESIVSLSESMNNQTAEMKRRDDQMIALLAENIAHGKRYMSELKDRH